MTTPTRSDIRTALSRNAAPKPRSADAFWEDFHARVPMYPQAEPVARQRTIPISMWALGTVSAILLAVVATWALYNPGGDALSTVDSFEVTARHSAVMILDDAETESTILWVVDMEGEGKNEGNT